MNYNCGGDFPPQVIGRSILTTSKRCSRVVHVNKTQHRKERHTRFYVKALNWEKPWGGGKASL